MSIAELIRGMAAAGASPEVIALAVEAVEAAEEAASRRRVRDSERKRARRQEARDGSAQHELGLASADKSGNVRGQSADKSDNVRGQSADTPFPEVSPQTPLPNPIPETPLNPPQRREGKVQPAAVELPDWLPPEPWRKLVAMRQGMRRRVPWTENSARALIAELGRLRGEGHCPAKLLEKAIAGGWRNLLAGKDTLADASRSSGPSWAPRTADELRRSIAAGEQFGWDVSAHREALERLEATGPPAKGTGKGTG